MSRIAAIAIVAVVAALSAVAAMRTIVARRRASTSPEARANLGPVINAPEFRTATTHRMQYYISLPSGWSKARTWPVVVAIPGSSKDWLASANVFAAARDARRYPFIVITPFVVAGAGRDPRHNGKYSYGPAAFDEIERDGRCQFDFDGITAVLDDVAREYRGQAKIFLTGFSGGGHSAVAYTLVHADRLRGAGLSAVNYSGRCVAGSGVVASEEFPEPMHPQPISSSPDRVTVPIRFFMGADDPNARYGVPARDRAMAAATAAGFANVSSVTIPGVRHEPMIAEVLDFFASKLAENER